jgi:hypothetical protein
MESSKEDKLKKLIEDKKNKNAPHKNKKGAEYGTIGNQHKAFKNKKTGGLFDK